MHGIKSLRTAYHSGHTLHGLTPVVEETFMVVCPGHAAELDKVQLILEWGRDGAAIPPSSDLTRVTFETQVKQLTVIRQQFLTFPGL